MIALIFVFRKDIKKIGIELIGMFLDLIGNANIFLYNRRTGKNLTYAKIVSGTYRKLTALIFVSTIPTILIGYQCKRLVVRSASSHMFSGIRILLTGVILLVVDYSNINGNKGTRKRISEMPCGWEYARNFCASRSFQIWSYDQCRSFAASAGNLR